MEAQLQAKAGVETVGRGEGLMKELRTVLRTLYLNLRAAGC